MLGYLDFLFLSYAGRIGRLTYWLAFFVLGLIECIAIGLLLFAARDVFAAANDHQVIAGDEVFTRLVLPSIIVMVLFLYPTYAVYTKRWHDRDKSGWWSLISFVPFIGGLWMFIELGFLGGSYGNNQYGSR